MHKLAIHGRYWHNNIMPKRKQSRLHALAEKHGGELLTFSQVLSHLGVPERTIRRWIAKGSFPRPIKDGRRNVWRKESVDQWTESLLPVPRNSSPLYGRRWVCTPLEIALAVYAYNAAARGAKDTGAEIFTDEDQTPGVGFLRIRLGKHAALIGLHAPGWEPLTKAGKYALLPKSDVRASYIIDLPEAGKRMTAGTSAKRAGRRTNERN